MNLHSRATAAAVLIVAFAALVCCVSSDAQMRDDRGVRTRTAGVEKPQARPLAELLHADRLTWHEVGQVAKAFNATMYWHARTDELLIEADHLSTIMVLGPAETVDGKILATGHILTEPTAIRKGLIINLGPEPVWVSPEEDYDPVEVFAGGVVGVGSHVIRTDGKDTDPNQCSVTCDEEYWACCNCKTGESCTCTCVKKGTYGWTCQSGGQGAASCSISRPDPGPGGS